MLDAAKVAISISTRLFPRFTYLNSASRLKLTSIALIILSTCRISALKGAPCALRVPSMMKREIYAVHGPLIQWTRLPCLILRTESDVFSELALAIKATTNARDSNVMPTRRFPNNLFAAEIVSSSVTQPHFGGN
jgi:hypothetical protein